MGWVSRRDLEGNGMRLFCLPHAGSGAAAFYRWKRLLPGGVQVCPVLLPGREIRLAERARLRVNEIVDGLMEELGGDLGRPYAVFGHSMGALLAYEWVRRIAAEGLPRPTRLIVSGRDAPHHPAAQRSLHRLEDVAFVEALGKKYGGLPEGFLEDVELREVFLPILRADLEVVETYEFAAGERLASPVMGFAGTRDQSVSEAGLSAWAELTAAGFTEQRFAGDHFYHAGGGTGQAELMRVLGEVLG